MGQGPDQTQVHAVCRLGEGGRVPVCFAMATITCAGHREAEGSGEDVGKNMIWWPMDRGQRW